jgi:hypothetical protein
MLMWGNYFNKVILDFDIVYLELYLKFDIMKTIENEPISPILSTNFNNETNESFLDTRYNGLTKLELATFMAMQGLCSNSYLILSYKNIARQSVRTAKETIIELNK